MLLLLHNGYLSVTTHNQTVTSIWAPWLPPAIPVLHTSTSSTTPRRFRVLAGEVAVTTLQCRYCDDGDYTSANGRCSLTESGTLVFPRGSAFVVDADVVVSFDAVFAIVQYGVCQETQETVFKSVLTELAAAPKPIRSHDTKNWLRAALTAARLTEAVF